MLEMKMKMIICFVQQLSQFWYNEETSTALAKEVVRVVGTIDRVCLISCPTLYSYIKKLNQHCQGK